MKTDMPFNDEEFEVYYKVSVKVADEIKYVFNKRTLVGDIDSAKVFLTLRSLKRCMALSDFKEYEIIRFSTKG